METRNLQLLVGQNIHEFRHSVSSLRNTVRWLERSLGPEHDSKLWKKLLDARADIQALERIITFFDMEQNTIAEPRETVQLFGDVIMKAAAESRERLRRFGLPLSRIRVEFRHVAIIPKLFLERSFLQHIIGNLVDNAVKYRDPSEASFRLVFEGDVSDSHYKVLIMDWGIGVPREWRERIFQDGERAPNAIRQVYSGTGMGLSIARHYAKRLGGVLELVEWEKPTVFVLGLPKELRA